MIHQDLFKEPPILHHPSQAIAMIHLRFIQDFIMMDPDVVISALINDATKSFFPQNNTILIAIYCKYPLGCYANIGYNYFVITYDDDH